MLTRPSRQDSPSMTEPPKAGADIPAAGAGGPIPNQEVTMAAVLKDPEIDIFELPVHPDAEKLPMIPPDELEELADDILENGLNDPVVIGQVNREWMLIDGRNRLAACKLAGVTPTYRIIDVENDADKLKSLIWSWNGTRRHMTSSQRAMAYAMMFPDPERGKRTDLLANANKLQTRSEQVSIARARFILKHDKEKAELVKDGHPDYSLTKTYETVKAAVTDRQGEAEKERQRMDRLAALGKQYPDLAELVKEEQLSLEEAIIIAERRIKEDEQVAKNLRATLLGSLSNAVLGARLFSHEDNAEQVLAILRNDQYHMEWNALFPRGWVEELRDLKQAKHGLDRLIKVFNPVLRRKRNDEQKSN